MKRNTALGSGLAAIAIATMALTGCSGGSSGGSSSAATDLTLAGVAFNASDPYWITLMCGGTKAAKEAGVTITWAAANTNAIAEQQTNFDAALLKDPDAVLLGASQTDTFSSQVGEVMDSGVPVIAVNGNIDPATDYQTVMSSTDNSEFIDFVVGDIGTTGTIGILGGIPGDIPVLTNRWKPLVEQLSQAAPDLKILDTQYDDFDRNKATTVAAALITGNPDLKAIYAVSGPEGEGAAAAVQEAGKSGEIKVYAYDATPGEVDALKAGTISALLAQPAGTIGAEGVKAAIEAAKANPDREPLTAQSESVSELPLKVLTVENVGDPAVADYIYSATCSE
jgi:ribose transport system substrate-binding protein